MEARLRLDVSSRVTSLHIFHPKNLKKTSSLKSSKIAGSTLSKSLNWSLFVNEFTEELGPTAFSFGSSPFSGYFSALRQPLVFSFGKRQT
jgi:hypothetical protein